MKKLALVGGLIGVRLPEYLAQLFYRDRETYRGQTIDTKACAVGRFVDLARDPGALPTVEESRSLLENSANIFDHAGPQLSRKEDLDIPVGDSSIAIRIYGNTTIKTDLQPAMVYFHGGGFIQGSIETHDSVCAKITKWSDGVVVSVGYRLAPEHPFPTGVDDAMAAYLWVCQNARDLGIDKNRIGVGGDSAGACLAAVVAQQARAKELPGTKFQVLIYPVTDGNLNSQSVSDLSEAYMLNKLRLDWYRDLYAGSLEDYNDPKFSPLLAKSFSNLPPAYVVTCGFDPLWDDGAAYSAKLEQANVPVTHHHFTGQIHAFIHLTKVAPDGTRVLKNISSWLNKNW